MQAELFDDLMTAHHNIVGVDEAGRGPLAGPVAAAAVILPSKYQLSGLTDSKALTAKQRYNLAEAIKNTASAWAIGWASVAEIDTLNILQATLLAMQRACKSLHLSSHYILVDGNHIPENLPRPAQAIVKGDRLVPAIAAASILAKTARDKVCEQLHERYPQYGFNQHKGYATRLHLERLQQYGACIEHRRSFAPVRRVIATTSAL